MEEEALEQQMNQLNFEDHKETAYNCASILEHQIYETMLALADLQDHLFTMYFVNWCNETNEQEWLARFTEVIPFLVDVRKRALALSEKIKKSDPENNNFTPLVDRVWFSKTQGIKLGLQKILDLLQQREETESDLEDLIRDAVLHVPGGDFLPETSDALYKLSNSNHEIRNEIKIMNSILFP